MPVTAQEAANRAAILTVDDDPGVSRAVARDLRRRYGEQHRIVRAESGDQALDALREMKLRGDLVAVILADYRMPQMNGIEFLEQRDGPLPGRAAGAAHRLRRHRRRHRRDQRGRPRPLPAQAVGSRRRRSSTRWSTSCWRRGRPPTTGRCPRPRSSATAGRPAPPRCASSWPATRCRTAGTHREDARAAAARRGRGRRAAAAGGDHAGRRGAGRADRRRAGRPGRAWPPRPPRTSTTWSSSAAAPPDWARRCTARPRGCAPCWSSAPPPAGRRGRAPGSRTTWAFPTGCPGRS